MKTGATGLKKIPYYCGQMISGLQYCTPSMTFKSEKLHQHTLKIDERPYKCYQTNRYYEQYKCEVCSKDSLSAYCCPECDSYNVCIDCYYNCADFGTGDSCVDCKVVLIRPFPKFPNRSFLPFLPVSSVIPRLFRLFLISISSFLY